MMPSVPTYWSDDPTVPFSTLLNVVDTYCHPEAEEEAYDKLKRRAAATGPDDTEMRKFKSELVRLLEGDRAGLHPYALDRAAGYDDGSDEAFLQRLWRDLYPDEPLPSPPDWKYWLRNDSGPFRTLLRVVENFCHPDAYPTAYADLIHRAKLSDPRDSEGAQFKAELIRLLSGDREGLPPGALHAAAQYEDGSDDAFLERLWRDLYPDESMPSSAADQV